MKLRVPNFYNSFHCIADRCKDSCCIGWEIDIDEDTYDYYQQVDGEFGKRLRKHMCFTEDGDHSFVLQEHGRCPFFNDTNLCDICICLGEEALSEVCTEYPRFSLDYGDVLQKCLSLSCEEVGRILFSQEEPMTFFEMEMENFVENDDEEELSAEVIAYEQALVSYLESVQNHAIALLQNRNETIGKRVFSYLEFLEMVQEDIDETEMSQELPDIKHVEFIVLKLSKKKEDMLLDSSYEDFLVRLNSLKELEVLDFEWENVIADFERVYTKENYQRMREEFVNSYSDSKEGFVERDYEHLLVYFTFRYFMTCAYNLEVLSYGEMAVLFTRIIMDMDVLRYHKNEKNFSRKDRIDTARIFSKEVEHSETNVEFLRVGE